jgi:hypothetical protein
LRGSFLAVLCIAAACGSTKTTADAGPTCNPTTGASGRCSSVADCKCPQTCAADLGFPYNVCEAPCMTNADCASPLAVCVGGSCNFNFCVRNAAGASASGSYGGTCNSVATNDGTCLELPNPLDSSSTVGACILAGTATSGCDTSYSSRDPSKLCGAGAVCASGSAGSTCYTICDPTADGGTCPQGSQTCQAIPGLPAHDGACI